MPTLLTTALSLYIAWAATLSDSLFHRVWSIALFLLSLLTAAIFNSPVSVSTVPLAVLDLLVFVVMYRSVSGSTSPPPCEISRPKGQGFGHFISEK